MVVIGLFKDDDKTRHIQIECSKDNKTYLLKADTEIDLTCAACGDITISELNDKYIDMNNLSMSRKNIKLYFENSGGKCN